MSKRIIRLPEVTRRAGLCRSAIYAAMAVGDFPKSVAIGKQAVGWIEDEIDAWIEARIAARDSEDKPRAA